MHDPDSKHKSKAIHHLYGWIATGYARWYERGKKMKFNFPEMYRDFSLKKVWFPFGKGIWNEYQNENFIITITGDDEWGYTISTSKKALLKEKEETLTDTQTLEEAWEVMKDWIERNSLRAEL